MTAHSAHVAAAVAARMAGVRLAFEEEAYGAWNQAATANGTGNFKNDFTQEKNFLYAGGYLNEYYGDGDEVPSNDH